MAKEKNSSQAEAQSTAQSRQIPDLLKAYYASIEDQQIPEAFLDLLEKLDAAEAKAAATGKGAE
ncbi:NepR family anti-sigma factor [Rhizobium alvei]|uniref:NepR family anti-sigma factor n=1 Tax=Rhizobium alvei TaxID=1132659 RepID=A0ABT8YNK5_9HYPH|nr:NepR family anti-sigma factor [Rhizobium alvei]MDO6965204.1 NepR family anti-sigma factor [Rhizobium alvei]